MQALERTAFILPVVCLVACGGEEPQLVVSGGVGRLGEGLTDVYSASVLTCGSELYEGSSCSAEPESEWNLSASPEERMELVELDSVGNAKRFTLHGVASGPATLLVKAGDAELDRSFDLEILTPDGGDLGMMDARDFDTGSSLHAAGMSPVFVNSELVIAQFHTALGKNVDGSTPFELSGVEAVFTGPLLVPLQPIHFRVHTGSTPGMLHVRAAAIDQAVEVVGSAQVDEVMACDDDCYSSHVGVRLGSKRRVEVSAKYQGERVLGAGVPPTVTIINGADLIATEIVISDRPTWLGSFGLMVEGKAVGEATLEVGWGAATRELHVHVRPS